MSAAEHYYKQSEQEKESAWGDRGPAARGTAPGQGETRPLAPVEGLQPVQNFLEPDKSELLVKETPAVTSKEQEEFSICVPVTEADGNGVIVAMDDWKVKTFDNGTRLKYEWNVVLHKARPPLHIPGAEMVRSTTFSRSEF